MQPGTGEEQRCRFTSCSVQLLLHKEPVRFAASRSSSARGPSSWVLRSGARPRRVGLDHTAAAWRLWTETTSSAPRTEELLCR